MNGILLKLKPGQSFLDALCAHLGVVSLDGWTLADVLGAVEVVHV